MTQNERGPMANGQPSAGAPADVVVVAADADRLREYEQALRRAQVLARATLDADEAEALVSGLNPAVLVLDRGLPRLILFRLYGLVREDADATQVQVVFVGQEGDTGPGDHYLPGDPTPSNVADRVAVLVSGVNAAPATDAVAEQAATAAVATPAPVTPVGTAAQPTTADAAGAAAATSISSTPAASSAAAVPETNGTVATDDDPDSESRADADEAPKPPARRLDVILIRVGLVLLILGALLILVQSDAYPPSLVAPGSAPSTPTRRPPASPTPGALRDGSEAPLVVVVLPYRA